MRQQDFSHGVRRALRCRKAKIMTGGNLSLLLFA